MIISALMAAAITVGTATPVYNTAEKQAELMTFTLLVCRPVLDPMIWDAWLPIASKLGVDHEEIAAMREFQARNPVPASIEVTEANCASMLRGQKDKLLSLLEQGA